MISASYDLVTRSRQEIIELCLRELRDVLPATRDAKLVKGTVVKEMHATFSPAPGSDRLASRAENRREDSVSRGRLDAHRLAVHDGGRRPQRLSGRGSLLASLGRPQKFLQPDLPLEGLCRMWARTIRESALGGFHGAGVVIGI